MKLWSCPPHGSNHTYIRDTVQCVHLHSGVPAPAALGSIESPGFRTFFPSLHPSLTFVQVPTEGSTGNRKWGGSLGLCYLTGCPSICLAWPCPRPGQLLGTAQDAGTGKGVMQAQEAGRGRQRDDGRNGVKVGEGETGET